MLHQSERLPNRRSRATWMAVSLAAILATACASLDSRQLAVGSSSQPAGVSAGSAAAPDVKPQETLADRKATARLSELARASKADSRDPKVALSYARALKGSGRVKDALTVLETAAAGPGASNRAIQIERGLLSLELGQAAEARQLLSSANGARSKDWRVLSGLGIASAALGQQAEAQRLFQTALDVSPNNAAVLNNMAMSYLLDQKVEQAEQMLRRAAGARDASPRVTQNLALTATLRGPNDDPAPAASNKVASETVRVENLPPMGLTKTQASRGGGAAR